MAGDFPSLRRLQPELNLAREDVRQIWHTPLRSWYLGFDTPVCGDPEPRPLCRLRALPDLSALKGLGHVFLYTLRGPATMCHGFPDKLGRGVQRPSNPDDKSSRRKVVGDKEEDEGGMVGNLPQ
ncbi:hypothetical protein FRC07_006071 [Ceratobasidium sp. 392]|nr:hypothetical protein FRC07_006071 [Ceratobasidium sp. 392]